MRIVYLEPVTFECHTTQNADGTHIPYETEFFDGKCDTFVEGFRIVPEGMSWTRSDGKIFCGEMIAPWKPFAEIEAAQREYEKKLLAEYEVSLKTVGVIL